jgi:alpha-beta hydrolase superfamily lysophospholipase
VHNGLTPWKKAGDVIGYAREVDSPKNVWLLLHGNAGQASDRAYAIPSFSAKDSVYILEYPGYGNRKGKPSRKSFNQAAKEAYLFLREQHPNVPVCVVGESIGSGPATWLAKVSPPPDRLVLIVPFDQLSLVAKGHVPSLLVSLALHDDWNNVEALADYKGPVEIFGAEGDDVIPIRHAKALAAAVGSSKFVTIKGGHNEWSQEGKVCIRNP